MRSYSAIASIYDKRMSDFDYDGYYAATSDDIRGEVVELALGSGEFTKRYAASVKHIQGVEISTEMLNIASVKLTKYRGKIALINNDMNTFEPMAAADTVLCVCDGVNYVASTKALFARIYDYLNGGGKLIFDISSEYKLREIIGDNIFYEDLDDMTYIWTNKCRDNHIDMDITVFDKVGELYSRHDEAQCQYIHSAQSIITDLTAAKFAVKTIDGENYGAVTSRSKRIIFICEKSL